MTFQVVSASCTSTPGVMAIILCKTLMTKMCKLLDMRDFLQSQKLDKFPAIIALKVKLFSQVVAGFEILTPGYNFFLWDPVSTGKEGSHEVLLRWCIGVYSPGDSLWCILRLSGNDSTTVGVSYWFPAAESADILNEPLRRACGGSSLVLKNFSSLITG